MIVTVAVVYRRRKKKFFRDLACCQELLQSARVRLAELTDIQHYFTKEEVEEYKKYYAVTYSRVKDIFHSYFIKKEQVDVGEMKVFAENYDRLDELRLENNKQNAILSNLTKDGLLGKAIDEFATIMSARNYLTESRKCAFIDKYKPLVDVLEQTLRQPELSPAIMKDLPDITEKACRDFCDGFKRIDELKKEKNQEYVRNELKEKHCYFQSVLKYPLSDQQRNAIVLDEDNVLVISSAGSGKTFSLQGKVKYLVEQRHVNPSNILLVTFTRKAAESLKQRINMEGVTCSTFDSLANRIVAKATGEKPNICDEKNVTEYVFNQLYKDPKYLKALTEYLLMNVSTSQSELEAETPQELVASRKASDHRTLLPCMDGHVVFAKSEQERIIGDILAMNGIQYRYEEKYEYNVATLEYKQYQPDFSIHFTVNETVTVEDADGNSHEETREVKKRVYLEHFGIGVDGKVPKWFADENETHSEATKRYNDGMQWKRRLHQEKGTCLLETYSYDFQLEGTAGVERRLLKMLGDAGVPIKPLSPEEIIKMMIASNPQRLRSVKTMVTSFVSLLKGGCHDLDSIVESLKSECDSYKINIQDIINRKEGRRKHIEYLHHQRDLVILEQIIKPYYQLYAARLRETGQKDFSDIIIEATRYCMNHNTQRYDYILIDEFQDLSIVRYKFIQALRSETPYRTKLFCVGDDWQSIYRFAGSDISLFNDFASYFGFVEECKIETTYRFGEPLVSLSSAFVLANPLQKKKEVRCLPLAHTDITCKPYAHNRRNNQTVASNVFQIVSQILKGVSEDKNLYFLGRYGFDVNVLEEAGFAVKTRKDRPYVIYNNREYPFLTVHQAKGLEAQYVILLNCNTGTYGFPSFIEDDPVLSYVLSESDQFRFGEERRLFYVAITRSSEHTYILYDEKRPSVFLNGFIDDTKPPYGYCPLCKDGHRVKFQERMVRSGKTMIEFRCSNERYGCVYRQVAWENRVSKNLSSCGRR